MHLHHHSIFAALPSVCVSNQISISYKSEIKFNYWFTSPHHMHLHHYSIFAPLPSVCEGRCLLHQYLREGVSFTPTWLWVIKFQYNTCLKWSFSVEGCCVCTNHLGDQPKRLEVSSICWPTQTDDNVWLVRSILWHYVGVCEGELARYKLYKPEEQGISLSRS